MGAQIQPRDVGSLSDTWKRMISYLRKYLRDFASINKLIEGEESKDNDLAFAILQTVEDINGTPPFTEYTLETLVDVAHQMSLVLEGSACAAISSALLFYSRNEVSFTDAGVNVAVGDKVRALQTWYQLKKSEYEQKKLKFKISSNITDILDQQPGMHSEYYRGVYEYISRE